MVKDFEEVSNPNKAYMHEELPRKVCRTGPPLIIIAVRNVSGPEHLEMIYCERMLNFITSNFKGHEYISLEIKIIMSVSKFLLFNFITRQYYCIFGFFFKTLFGENTTCSLKLIEVYFHEGPTLDKP